MCPTLSVSDGVQIGWDQHGNGPPVLLVHGGVTDRRSWGPVIPALSARATVCAMDRRGRGLSGDGEDRSLEREARDVVEVMGALECSKVVGHSFGALVVLHALRHLPSGARAVLYEPPGRDALHPEPGLLEDIARQSESGDLDGALHRFVTSELLLSERVYEALSAHPLWETMRLGAAELPREFRTVARTPFTHEEFRDVRAAVLLLVAGEGGSPMFRRFAEEIAGVLPDATVETVAGVPHFATSTDPEFADRVAAFVGLTD